MSTTNPLLCDSPNWGFIGTWKQGWLQLSCVKAPLSILFQGWERLPTPVLLTTPLFFHGHTNKSRDISPVTERALYHILYCINNVSWCLRGMLACVRLSSAGEIWSSTASRASHTILTRYSRGPHTRWLCSSPELSVVGWSVCKVLQSNEVTSRCWMGSFLSRL